MITFLFDETDFVIAAKVGEGKSTLAFHVAKYLQGLGLDVEVHDMDLTDEKWRKRYETNLDNVVKSLKEKGQSIVIRTAQLNRNALLQKWKRIFENAENALFSNEQEIKDASERLFEFVQSYIENHKISCPESIHQSDEINLDAPHFMEKCCEIVGFFHKEENA